MTQAEIDLQPLAPAHWLALIEGEPAFARAFGRPAGEGLRDFVVGADVSPDWVGALESADHTDPFVHGFAIVCRSTGAVIGNLGFKGGPDARGEVEIAYGVIPSREGRGVATAAAAAGLAFAFADARVRRVCAHTLARISGSTRVLERNGFELVGEVHDPDDGLLWRWERGRPEA